MIAILKIIIVLTKLPIDPINISDPSKQEHSAILYDCGHNEFLNSEWQTKKINYTRCKNNRDSL